MLFKVSFRVFRSNKTFATRKYSFFDKVGRNWERAWSDNVTPWDTGTVTKPLIHEIDLGSISISNNSRALVPGCGSGHDCFHLRKSGFSEVVGIDLSQTAVDRCNSTYPNASHENITFQCADFFTYENGKFDFIFDYLFFSAMDPEMRPLWAQAMAKHIAPNSGRLFTLMFPVDGNKGTSGGPPYNVHPDDYKVNFIVSRR
jgi:methyl halide transferase